MPLSIVLANMEYEGIRVDASVLKEMNVELTKKIEEISNKVYELTGFEFNISSPKQ